MGPESCERIKVMGLAEKKKRVACRGTRMSVTVGVKIEFKYGKEKDRKGNEKRMTNRK